MNRITLYTHPSSPYATCVELALKEADAEYEKHIVDLVRKPDWFVREVNPAGQVPTISYAPPCLSGALPPPNAFHLAESLVILSFLADIFPHLLPTSPIDRARARFFMAKVQEKVVPAWFGAFTTGAVGLDVLVEKLGEIQELLANDTNGKVQTGRNGDDGEESGYATGGWSIADAYLSPFLYLAEIYLRNDAGAYAPGGGPVAWVELFENEKFRRLQAYLRKVQARKSWKVMTDEAYMLAFLPKFMAFIGAKRSVV